jgi:broad specificity phosphatase PhoE
MSLTIHFLRHAVATHNEDAVVRGNIAYEDPIHVDATLTDTGVDQAFNTCLDHGRYGAIFCSPLKRCRQTLLAALPESRDIAVIVDDRLMEPQGHICNCRADRSSIAEEVSVWDLTGVAAVNPYTGYESDTAFRRRIIEFTDALRTHSEKAGINEVLVVSHHEWIRLWFAIFQQKEVSPRNCQLLTAKI